MQGPIDAIKRQQSKAIKRSRMPDFRVFGGYKDKGHCHEIRGSI